MLQQHPRLEGEPLVKHLPLRAAGVLEAHLGDFDCWDAASPSIVELSSRSTIRPSGAPPSGVSPAPRRCSASAALPSRRASLAATSSRRCSRRFVAMTPRRVGAFRINATVRQAGNRHSRTACRGACGLDTSRERTFGNRHRRVIVTIEQNRPLRPHRPQGPPNGTQRIKFIDRLAGT